MGIDLGDKVVETHLAYFSFGLFSCHDLPLAFSGDVFPVQKRKNSIVEY